MAGTANRNVAEITVKKATFTEVEMLWQEYGTIWKWQDPFVTPPWLYSWWSAFGGDFEPFLLVISEGESPLGFAPLIVRDGFARFMGSGDLCDTGDFIISPGREELFFRTLLNFLESEGVYHLVLEPVRPDSLVCLSLIQLATTAHWHATCAPHGASLQMALPATWEHYLNNLDRKQRHEVRRKLRRLREAGVVEQRSIRTPEETGVAMDLFLQLFRQSRSDKDTFMTEQREGFFRTLADELAKVHMLNLLWLTIDNEPAAVVFCVENRETVYLYNNGFDPRFREFSIGIVSKLITIRSSIETGQQVYDFLNGRERYKYHLGGTEVPLSTCTIEKKN